MLGAYYKTIEANDLRFGCLEAGRGQPVLCLHGFPDTAHTFDRLLSQLAEAGYHAVAPATRRIYPTSVPLDKDYSPLQLGRDALALIQVFDQGNWAFLAFGVSRRVLQKGRGFPPPTTIVAKGVTMKMPSRKHKGSFGEDSAFCEVTIVASEMSG